MTYAVKIIINKLPARAITSAYSAVRLTWAAVFGHLRKNGNLQPRLVEWTTFFKERQLTNRTIAYRGAFLSLGLLHIRVWSKMHG